MKKISALILSVIISICAMTSCGSENDTVSSKVTTSYSAPETTIADSSEDDEEIPQQEQDPFKEEVLNKLNAAKEKLDAFDFDEENVKDGISGTITAVCTITIDDTSTEMLCTFYPSDDNKIYRTSLKYNDMLACLSEFYTDETYTQFKSDSEIAAIDKSNIKKMLYAGAVMDIENLNDDIIYEIYDSLNMSLETYRATGSPLINSEYITASFNNNAYTLLVADDVDLMLSLEVEDISHFNQSASKFDKPNWYGLEV